MIEKLTESLQGAIQGAVHNLWVGIITGIANSSYYICLFRAFIFLLLYIMGHKKYAKFVPVTYVLYVILQALKLALI